MAVATTLAVASLALSVGGALAGGRAKRKAIRQRMRAQLAQQRQMRANVRTQLGEYSRRANNRLGQYLSEEYDLDADAASVMSASGVDLSQGSSLLIREKAKSVAIEKHSNLVEDMIWKRRQAESQISASLEMDKAIKQGADMQAQAAELEQTIGVMKGLVDFGTGISTPPSGTGDKPKTSGTGDFNVNPTVSRTA